MTPATSSATQLALFAATGDPAEEAAKTLIRPYVKRGDDPKWIRDGHMGTARTEFWAQIGGYMNGRKYGTDKILVTEVNGEEVNRAFSFQKIYDAVKSEA